MKKLKLLSITLLFVLFYNNFYSQCDVYKANNGLVIMEAENTKSALGLWILKKDVPNYKGSGHLEFTGNSVNGGKPNSPLKYKFKIEEAGIYRLVMRTRKRINPGDEGDKSNDSWVKVEGDYVAPTNVPGSSRITPTSSLMEDSKMFGGDRNTWGYSVNLDVKIGPKSEHIRPAFYQFKAGEIYTFTLSGRAKQNNVDRIIFYKIDQYSLGKIRTDAAIVSESLCNNGSILSINDHKSQNIAYQTYPNPFKDYFYITSKTIDNLKMFSITGVEIPVTYERIGNKYKIEPVTNISKGVYIVSVLDNSNNSYFKITK